MSLDLHNEQKQDKLNAEWLKVIKKKVWSQLDQVQKRPLCKRFGLNYDSSMVSAGIKGYGVEEAMKDLLRKTSFDLKKAEKAVIILDEVDKLLLHHNGDSIAIQLLRLIEGADIPLNHYSRSEELEFREIGSINSKNMLFFFAGSFQQLIEGKKVQSGFSKENDAKGSNSITISDIEKTMLPPELLGRIGKMVILNELIDIDFKEILINSKRSPIKRYQEMLSINDVVHDLSDEDIDEIVTRAMKSKYGARALEQIAEEYFEDILFDAPSMRNKSVNIMEKRDV